MEIQENYLPGKLYLSFGGEDGLKGEPISLVENDLIAQNLLKLAYEKPLSISELSKSIGIPAAYIEPIVQKLVDGELMVRMDSGKVYSDFIITKPQDSLKNFKAQLDFAHKHFETVWRIIERMSEKISKMEFVKDMDDEQRRKLDRYAVLEALQNFQYLGTGKFEIPKYPKRKDGGWWFAQAMAIDAGYNMKEYNESSEYCIHGGHRTLEALVENGTRRVNLHEFDTTLWDSPHRYGCIPDGLYFKHILTFLWCVYNEIPLEENTEYDVPNEIISNIPSLKTVGMIGNKENKLCVKIPVIKNTEYEELCAEIKNATEEIKSAIGEEFASFISSMKTPVPKHLTSVPELFRYHEATKYFAMSIVREAYDKGMHLKNVDYCCPPVVMVCACKD